MTFTQELFAQAATEWDLERLYTDLASAKHKVAPHKKKGLTEVEKLHLRGLLCGYSPTEVAAKLIKTAKGVEVDLSNTLYRYAETLTDRPLNTLENWRDIVEWLTMAGYRQEGSGLLAQGEQGSKGAVAAIPPKSSHASETAMQELAARNARASATQNCQDWGEAPDVCVFYGRTEELTTLKQWIVSDRCRLVALLGMGGIGKTALSVRLAEQIQGEFEYLIWRSLRHAPPIEALLSNLMEFFCGQQENQSDLSRLLDFFKKHRCLVVLDEPEAILQPGNPVGHYREGFQGYGELLRRVGVERHNSCLILTSREKPKEIASLEGEKLSVRSLMLSSLQAAAKDILQERGLLCAEDKWQTLIKIYGGNPLALRMVSATIKDLFGGNVTEFLKQSTIVIGDIRQLLDRQFERLSDLEKNIMYELAIHPAPTSLVQLVEYLSLTQSKSELIEALDSLGRRSLLEKITIESEVLFSLQPVVMKYIKKMYSVS